MLYNPSSILHHRSIKMNAHNMVREMILFIVALFYCCTICCMYSIVVCFAFADPNKLYIYTTLTPDT